MPVEKTIDERDVGRAPETHRRRPGPVGKPRSRFARRGPAAAIGRLRPVDALAARLALEADVAGPDRARSRDRRYRRLLIGADLLAIATSLVVCIPLLGDGDEVAPTALVALPLVVVLSKVLGLYDRDELLMRKSTLDEAPSLFQLATLAALLVGLAHGSLVAGELGRDQLIAVWLSLLVLLILFRTLGRAVGRHIAPVERCLLVGDSEACGRAREKIDTSPVVHARVVSQISFEAAAEALDAEAAIGGLAEELDVHRVVVAPPSVDRGEVLNLIRAAKAHGLKVSVLPRMLEAVGTSVEFDDVEGMEMLGVRRFGMSRSSWLIKRTMDVLGSTVALLLLSPLLALIATAIKVDSRGPVLFRQRRVGRDGETFEMLKFRTMVVGADDRKHELEELNEADGLFKIADDPRVTSVGRLLRRYSIDELPQLWNVLRGEMSLVGPRPLVEEDDRRVEGWYRRRLHLMPGMTGRWQVLGSARIPLNEMVKLDYLYVANWSLWTDVKILLRTAQFVFGRRGL